MSGITKKPWIAKRLANYQEPGWVILWSDKGGTHMRRLDYRGNFTEEDARLIAAAPELLAACRGMDAHYSGSLDHQPAYVGMARAAIAKATEGAP